MESDAPSGTAAGPSDAAPQSPDGAGAPGVEEQSARSGNQLQLRFRERFESLLPTIQKEWPEVARHTLEATRGSFDQVVEAISRQSGSTGEKVKGQLLELVHATGDQAQHLGDSLKPLEDQLEKLLDELNATLRPRITRPVREKPLLAISVAAGVGLLVGLLLGSGRRGK
jgi:ElaB/YqjD/DUF883 family membrane-anchored ribosome-binding protein